MKSFSVVYTNGEGNDSAAATPVTPTRMRRDGETTVFKHFLVKSE